MSRLIALIMLSILSFPLTALVYSLVVIAYMENVRYHPRRENSGMMLAGTVAWAFMACYWIALWRKSVRWSGDRVKLTALSFLAAAFTGGVIGAVVGQAGDELGYFFASVTPPLLWQVATIFIWRESAAERAARVTQSGADGIVCPTCGYNLTGLKSTRCPECGSEFTLDQLVAEQPARSQAELET